MTEGKPLDLEWLGKVLRTNNDGEFKSWCEKFNRDLKKAVKQQIKSTCEFYLKYKDNPSKLWNERIDYIKKIKKDKELWKFIEELNKNRCITLRKYNEWLFKLAFKPVFEEVKERCIGK